MDRSIPASAARILDFIGNTEAPRGYDTVFGNRKMPQRLTTMTLDEVIADGPRRTREYRSSAAGRYQFMTQTLKGLKKELGLSGSESFDADLQDRLAFHLLKRRKWEQFEAGKIGLSVFAKQLAMEWASFPVLRDTQGAKGRIKRGQSYYAGDGMNRALVSPEQIEALLAVPKLQEATMPTTKPVVIHTPAAPTAPPVVIAPAPENPRQLPSLQEVQNFLSSKTVYGILAAAVSMVGLFKPDLVPFLQPLAEQGWPLLTGILGLALALYGRFMAQGPLGFFLGGGMSDVKRLQEQVSQLTTLVEAQLAEKKARAKV